MSGSLNAISKSDTRRLTRSLSRRASSPFARSIWHFMHCLVPATGRRRLRSHEMIHTRLLKRNVREDLHIASHKVVLFSPLVSLPLPLPQLTYCPLLLCRALFLRFFALVRSPEKKIKLCIVFMDMNKPMYACTRADEIVAMFEMPFK